MSFKFETAAIDRYEILKEFAKKNRREMTKSETILWNALRHQIQGYKFRRQHPIGDFIVDYVCLSEKLVVEVDGEYHDSLEQKIEDQARTNYLQEKGFKVIRFKNDEVNINIKDVIQKIKEELNKE